MAIIVINYIADAQWCLHITFVYRGGTVQFVLEVHTQTK